MEESKKSLATFNAYDSLEVKRYAKSLDMAICIFDIMQLLHNDFESVQELKKSVNQKLEESNIIIHDLID